VHPFACCPNCAALGVIAHSCVRCRAALVFDGAAAVLSAAEFLHCHQLPGFLLILDFSTLMIGRVWPGSTRFWRRVGSVFCFGGGLLLCTEGPPTTSCSIMSLWHWQWSFPSSRGPLSLPPCIAFRSSPSALERFLRVLMMGGLRKASLGYMDDIIMGAKSTVPIFVNCRDRKGSHRLLGHRFLLLLPTSLLPWHWSSSWS
jgi:hypothetical protein